MKSQSIEAQQKEFFDFFEAKTGCRPEKMELVSVSGTRSSLKTLGLELPAFQKDLWGLLVYCGEKLFFYIHPTEYSYMGLVRKDSSKEMKIEEQLVCFTDFASFSVSVPVHPHWIPVPPCLPENRHRSRHRNKTSHGPVR